MPEYGTDSVAQHTFALLLELCNRTALNAAAVAAGEWSRSPTSRSGRRLSAELSGLTMGIVGSGRIGRRVAEIARAFGMNVIAGSARPSERAKLADLFARADVVSLALSPHRRDRGPRRPALLRRMKRTAFLLNTARGGLVDEAALRAALEAGELAGAGFDVASREPIEPSNPLLGAPNLVLTPHLAWASLAARRRLMDTTARNVEAFLAGAPINVVN